VCVCFSASFRAFMAISTRCRPIEEVVVMEFGLRFTTPLPAADSKQLESASSLLELERTKAWSANGKRHSANGPAKHLKRHVELFL